MPKFVHLISVDNQIKPTGRIFEEAEKAKSREGREAAVAVEVSKEMSSTDEEEGDRRVKRAVTGSYCLLLQEYVRGK